MNGDFDSRFNPGHLADLRKSGLSDETILEAGIKSVCPRDIDKIFRYPTHAKSAYESWIGGCDIVRPHWRNLDYITPHYNYNPILIDFNIDLEKKEKWPIEANSYDLVYTSNTFEHLYQETVDFVLKEIYRILKNGGGLRIAVPNIDLPLWHYKTGDKEWFKIHFPPARWESQFPKRKGDYQLEYVLIDYFAASLVYEVSQEEVRKDFNSMDKINFLEKYRKLTKNESQIENPGLHRNWFDFDKLNKLLKEAGFSKIVKNQHRQSIFTEFCNKGIDETVKELAIYVDAIKE